MSNYYNLERAIASLKRLLLESYNGTLVIEGWVNKKTVLRFLDYSDNQLKKVEKVAGFVMSKVGRRKFYKVESIIRLLNENIKKTDNIQ